MTKPTGIIRTKSSNRSPDGYPEEFRPLARSAVVLGFAVAVWAFCAALIAVGRQFMDMHDTLIVHAIGAPLGAASLTWLYFRCFAFTSPLATAVTFVTVALVLDFLVVGMLIERSFSMFASLLGVWLPQVLIFMATYMTGHHSTPHQSMQPEGNDHCGTRTTEEC